MSGSMRRAGCCGTAPSASLPQRGGQFLPEFIRLHDVGSSVEIIFGIAATCSGVKVPRRSPSAAGTFGLFFGHACEFCGVNGEFRHPDLLIVCVNGGRAAVAAPSGSTANAFQSGEKYFPLATTRRFDDFAILFGVADLHRPIGEAGLPLDVFGVPKGDTSARPFTVPLASTHAQENKIFRLVGLKLVLPVLRYHYPFMLSDDRRPSVLKVKVALPCRTTKM